MIGLNILLDMVATEALEGGATEHYFDEARNSKFIPPQPLYGQSSQLSQGSKDNDLPPINYTLQLIKNPDGSLHWIE